MPPQELRSEFFSKVERLFTAGLRSPDPQLRRSFFSLYHAAVPPTLYDRLFFIICTQDWEYAAASFWLKHALVSGR
jgi:transformation/transcription domain-associated protein